MLPCLGATERTTISTESHYSEGQCPLMGMTHDSSMRHPAAFVSSATRMSWGSAPRHWALSQPAVMRAFLAPFRPELEDLDARGGDIIDPASLLWKVLNHIVLVSRDRHPGWLIVKYEDLSLDPIPGFRARFERLGLDLSDRVRATIEASSDDANPDQAAGSANSLRLHSKRNVKAWAKRLSPQAIAKTRARVEPIAASFYGDADWSTSEESNLDVRSLHLCARIIPYHALSGVARSICITSATERSRPEV